MMAMVKAEYSLDRGSETASKIAYSRNFNFVYSFRPIYDFCRLFGLMPFSFTFNSNGTLNGFEIGTFDILWFIISLILNLTLAFMLSTDLYYMNEIKIQSVILDGGDFINQIFCSVFDAILIAIDLCICSKLVQILKKINIFDEKVC